MSISSLLLLFTFYSNYSFLQEPSISQSKIVEINHEAEVTKSNPQQNLYNIPSTGSHSNKRNNIDISSIERCEIETTQLLQEQRQIQVDAQNIIESQSNFTDLSRALALLVSNEVISLPRAYFMVPGIETRLASQNFVELQSDKIQDLDDEHKSLFREFMAINRKVNSDEQFEFSTLLDLKKTLPDVRIKSRGKTSIFSANRAISKYLVKQPIEWINALPSDTKLDEAVLISVIENTSDIEKITAIAKLIDFKERRPYDRNGNLSTALDAAVKKGNVELISHMAKILPSKRHPFSIPQANHVIARLIESREIDQLPEKISALLALTLSNEPLKLWFNSEQNTYSIIGYNKRVTIGNEQLKLLVANDLPFDIVQDLPVQAEDISLFGDYISLQVLIDSYKSLSLDKLEKQKECKEKVALYVNNQPSFKSHLQAIEKNTSPSNSFYENVERLQQISPALVDHYYNAHQFTEMPTTNMPYLHRIIDGIKNNSLDEALAVLGEKQLAPSEQTYIAQQICMSGDITLLQRSLSILDTIQFHSPQYSECLSDADNYKRIYFSTSHTHPSLGYDAISRFRFDDAIELLDKGESTAGFPGGRDGLALFLDRIVASKMPPVHQQIQILERLVQSQDLTDMHYARLHRLKIKNPELFNTLARLNSQVLNATLVPFNEYK
ncbi:hypothetical protein [Glaciecola sp. SC05]|uniref:hypothetical protein n=1 Tax=Glaciecola sp. SC05 TaxID=1987355 RepID=UPI00352724C1